MSQNDLLLKVSKDITSLKTKQFQSNFTCDYKLPVCVCVGGEDKHTEGRRMCTVQIWGVRIAEEARGVKSET